MQYEQVKSRCSPGCLLCICAGPCRESMLLKWRAGRAAGREIQGVQDKMQSEFQVGAIASVHGIKGEVKVFPTTDEPEKFKKLKTVVLRTAKEERELRLQSARFFKNMVIVKFVGIESPEEAQKYKGATLWIEREQAVPLENDEYYQADLIGLSVLTEDGEELGMLTDILETGANDVYEITLRDGRKVLFPAIRDCVKEVDMEAGRMTVHVMEGLLDLAR